MRLSLVIISCIYKVCLNCPRLCVGLRISVHWNKFFLNVFEEKIAQWVKKFDNILTIFKTIIYYLLLTEKWF